MFSSRNVKRALLWYRRLWLLGLRGLPHHAVGLNPPFTSADLAERLQHIQDDHVFIAQR